MERMPSFARKRPQLLCSILAVRDPAHSEGRKPTVKLCRAPLATPTSMLHLAAGRCGPILFCNIEMGERGHLGSLGMRVVTLCGALFLHCTAVSAFWP